MTADGRIYYIDHNNQRTTWEKPRYITRQPTAAERGGNAPPTKQVKLQISLMHAPCILLIIITNIHLDIILVTTNSFWDLACRASAPMLCIEWVRKVMHLECQLFDECFQMYYNIVYKHHWAGILELLTFTFRTHPMHQNIGRLNTLFLLSFTLTISYEWRKFLFCGWLP